LTASAPPPPRPRESAAALLAELEAAHANLLERIAELGAVTDQPQPTRLESTSARMRLSQASIERRAVLNRALRYLGERADPAAAQTIAKIRAADGELIAHSVAHLAKWTAQNVDSDWLGYREASRSMRDHMAGTVKAEAQLLKPLLK
jgi:hypothetical protein